MPGQIDRPWSVPLSDIAARRAPAARLLTLPPVPYIAEAQVDQVAGALSAALAAQTAAREPEEARS